jgi:hypothetical protein
LSPNNVIHIYTLVILVTIPQHPHCPCPFPPHHLTWPSLLSWHSPCVIPTKSRCPWTRTLDIQFRFYIRMLEFRMVNKLCHVLKSPWDIMPRFKVKNLDCLKKLLWCCQIWNAKLTSLMFVSIMQLQGNAQLVKMVFLIINILNKTAC